MLWIMRTGFAAGLAFAVPLTSSASIDPQGSNSETRIWSSVTEAGRSTGETEYVFDTVLNKTTASFRASLASGNVFARLFRSPPPVHTLIADYEFPGRTSFQPPEMIRVSLMSSEFKLSGSGYRPSSEPRPVLVIVIGDRIARYHVGIAQTIEEWSVPNRVTQVSESLRGIDPRANSPAGPMQLDIERTSTAWIPICDFLILVRGRSAHGTVAGLEFDLNEGVVSGLRQFAKKMVPEALARENCHR